MLRSAAALSEAHNLASCWDALGWWRGKQRRSAAFDRMVDRGIRSVVSGAFYAWDAALTHAALRHRLVASAALRLGGRLMAQAFGEWRGGAREGREGRVRVKEMVGAWSFRRKVSERLNPKQ